MMQNRRTFQILYRSKAPWLLSGAERCAERSRSAEVFSYMQRSLFDTLRRLAV